MIGAFLGGAVKSLLPRRGGLDHSEIVRAAAPPSRELLRAYAAWAGAPAGRYEDTLPPHFVAARMALPVISALTARSPYPLLGVLNQGIHLGVHAPVPATAPITVRGRLVDASDDGYRARIHSTLTVGTPDIPVAMSLDAWAAVTAETVVATGALAALNLGALVLAGGPHTESRSVTVRNVAPGTRRYDLSFAFRQGDGEARGLTPSVPGGKAVAGASSALGAVAGAGALGAGVGTLPLGNLLGDLQAQMRKAAEEERQAGLRERRADQKKRGLTAEQVEAEDRQAAQEELRDAEKMVAMLRDSRPLSAAELDECVDHYARFAKLSSDAPQCSPGSLRRVLAPTMVLPMAAAPIRMMLGSLRELDKEMAEARRTFAAMTPDDRKDFVQQMAAQFEEWSDEEREGFAALVRADALGMPQAMRDALLKRLRP